MLKTQFCKSEMENISAADAKWSWTGSWGWDSDDGCIFVADSASEDNTAWVGTYKQDSLEWSDYGCTAEMKWSSKSSGGERGVFLRMNGDSSELNAFNGYICTISDAKELMVQTSTSAGLVNLVSTKLPHTLSGGAWYNLTATAYGESVMCKLEADDGQHNVTANTPFYTVSWGTHTHTSHSWRIGFEAGSLHPRPSLSFCSTRLFDRASACGGIVLSAGGLGGHPHGFGADLLPRV